MIVDPSLLDLLVCPRDRTALSEDGSTLKCAEGHRYPVVEGIPVLFEDGPKTIWVAENSLKHAWHQDEFQAKDPYHLDTMISRAEQEKFKDLLNSPTDGVDPVVSILISATNGIAYLHLVGKLKEYPIPHFRLPPAKGEVMLDIGCNWGRWCMAAARLGYRPIGIDPSLGALLAAKRVTTKLGLNVKLVCGDARSLPFRDDCFDVVFSYSVIQHFSRQDAIETFQEIGRTLRPKGKAFIQMPTTFGLRCLYHQARRGFREGTGFEVRYWSVPTLKRLFQKYVGQTTFSVDCFFGIGLQVSDLRLMPPSYRAVIHASELLRTGSRFLPWFRYVADSVYVESIKNAAN
jgi:SAM-dependent methyltransferase/uncharacterized protein YbaR (Trm112 family)